MKLMIAITALTSILTAQALAGSAQHEKRWSNPLRIDYRHNYGPGPIPGTYATYNGPARQWCKQSAANYRGQNGRLYPCS